MDYSKGEEMRVTYRMIALLGALGIKRTEITAEMLRSLHEYTSETEQAERDRCSRLLQSDSGRMLRPEPVRSSC